MHGRLFRFISFAFQGIELCLFWKLNAIKKAMKAAWHVRLRLRMSLRCRTKCLCCQAPDTPINPFQAQHVMLCWLLTGCGFRGFSVPRYAGQDASESLSLLLNYCVNMQHAQTVNLPANTCSRIHTAKRLGPDRNVIAVKGRDTCVSMKGLYLSQNNNKSSKKKRKRFH